MRRSVLLPAVLAALVGAGGCASDEATVLDGGELAAAVDRRAEAEDGAVDGATQCPDLRLEEGQTVRCTRRVLSDGVEVISDLTVEVTDPAAGADGLALEPDPDPTVTVLPQTLEAYLRARIGTQLGRAPDTVTCRRLPARAGASVTCRVTDRGRERGVRVTAAAVDGTEVTLRYRVR